MSAFYWKNPDPRTLATALTAGAECAALGHGFGFCRSGLLTAMVGFIEDRDQEIATTALAFEGL